MRPLSNEDQRILHFLNRTSFGATAGEMMEVKKKGISSYLEKQLYPESIPDPRINEKLERYRTLHLTSKALLERYPRQNLKNRGNQMGMAQTQSPRTILMELQQAKVLRAVYSRRQLYEVMVDFWSNHFNVFANKGVNRWLVTAYDRDTIRPHVFGSFRDLLVATAQSPAMLFYLDNWLSVSPESWNRRRPSRKSRGLRRGLNENYARELLELHTLGVNGGYTQRDVEEVARCFTGWTIFRPRKGGIFRFNIRFHDNGEKTVLGTRIPAGGGMEDGLRVMNILTRHPSTAHFISSKLVRRFVADEPPPDLVRKAAAAFQQTDGDIRSVLRVIFGSSEFYATEFVGAKVKKPVELVASALRSLGAETEGHQSLIWRLGAMGEPLFLARPPTGFPDVEEYWINPATLLARLNFALDLASNRIRGVQVATSRSEGLRLASPAFQRR